MLKGTFLFDQELDKFNKPLNIAKHWMKIKKQSCLFYHKQPPKCNSHKGLTILAFVIHCYLEGTSKNAIFPVGRAGGFVRLDRLLQRKSRQSVLTMHCSVWKDPHRTQETRRKVPAFNIVVCWF